MRTALTSISRRRNPHRSVPIRSGTMFTEKMEYLRILLRFWYICDYNFHVKLPCFPPPLVVALSLPLTHQKLAWQRIHHHLMRKRFLLPRLCGEEYVLQVDVCGCAWRNDVLHVLNEEWKCLFFLLLSFGWSLVGAFTCPKQNSPEINTREALVCVCACE